MSKIENLYKEIGGNYEKAKAYVSRDEMLIKYLKRYNGSEKVTQLREAISVGNFDKASMWAEEVYEMALTLSLTPVVEKALELMKRLKDSEPNADVADMLDELEGAISKVHKVISDKLK